MTAMIKKQIVFVEPRLYEPTFKIARTLKLTGRYETVMICFKDVDKDYAKKAFDKIIVFKVNFALSLKNLFELFRKLTEGETYAFIRQVRKLKPYVINVRRSSIESVVCLILSRKYPTIFNISDILNFPRKNKSFRAYIKNKSLAVSMLSERLCIKLAGGILNKSGEGSLNFLEPKTNKPVIDFLPYCLDEWILPPQKRIFKKNKEIHLVYAGSFIDNVKGHVPLSVFIDKITAQKIHLHVYIQKNLAGDFPEKLKQIAKNNKFFHYHEGKRADRLN